MKIEKEQMSQPKQNINISLTEKFFQIGKS